MWLSSCTIYIIDKSQMLVITISRTIPLGAGWCITISISRHLNNFIQTGYNFHVRRSESLISLISLNSLISLMVLLVWQSDKSDCLISLTVLLVWLSYYSDCLSLSLMVLLIWWSYYYDGLISLMVLLVWQSY